MKLENICLKKKVRSKIIFGLTIFMSSLLLFIQNSSALHYEFKGEHMAMDEKEYPILVVELPYELYYQNNYKEVWGEIWKNISSITNFIKINEEILSRFEGFSFLQLIKFFNATIWKKSDGYVKIIVPNETHDEIVKILKELGLKVRPNLALNLHLSKSRRLIGLPYYYDYGSELTGRDMRIAIIDSGVDTNHPDLPWGKKVIFWNDTLYSPGEYGYLPTPADPDGHGTHLCSIAAGTGKSSSGLYKGIAPNAYLLVWRSCERGVCEINAIAEAINQAISRDVDVISISLGVSPQIWSVRFSKGWMPCSFVDACLGNCPPGTDIQNLFDAIHKAISNNIPVVVSVGNDGSHPGTVNFPACIKDVIAVGASHKNDYTSFKWNTDLWPYQTENVVLHTIISIPTDNPPQIFDEEFSTTWRFNGIPHNVEIFEPVGFQKIIKPQNWPATIRVQIEGEHKHRDCYQAERNWWDPGTKDKGDAYWIWEQTFNYDPSNPYIVVEIGALANGATGWCWFDIGGGWYNAYFNTYTCSGTALSCESFDHNRNGCENQLGCRWCGWQCYMFGIPIGCYETDQTGGLVRCSYEGCTGTAVRCEERHQHEGEICGTPSTTGCTASWDTRFISVRMYRTNAFSLEGLPTFYSSRGPFLAYIKKPDVTAPGHLICAAKATNIKEGPEKLICGNENYVAYFGTSTATSMVAGAVALIKEAVKIVGINPSVYDIKEAVKKANEKVFSGNPDDEEGYGMINVQKAIDFITNGKLKYSLPRGGGTGGEGGSEDVGKFVPLRTMS